MRNSRSGGSAIEKKREKQNQKSFTSVEGVKIEA